MEPEIRGARWWKVDFHAHTPASMDYGKGPDQTTLRQTTPEEWLLDYMSAGIDAVVVTDHNTGDWVDRLKTALESTELRTNRGYRPLVLFPGVEITANGSIHVLAVFDPAATPGHIDALLGACGFNIDKKGTSEEACSCSPEQVVQKIHEAGAIPILAHVDQSQGAFRELNGNTLGPLLDSRDLYVYEQHNSNYTAPAIASERARNMTQVLGSDSHHRTGNGGQRYPGSHFTWVKMEEPDLAGLRLALLDGNGLSIYRSDEIAEDLNALPELWIEHINVQRARLMGNGSAFQTSFSPKLNAVIGGRGTGKSTLLEFMRMAFDRYGELPHALKTEFDGYFGKGKLVAGDGAYRPDTSVKVVIWKDGRRLSLDFKAGENEPRSYYWDGSTWQPSVGSIQGRFPISIYSQKQVFSMATNRFGLLRRIDERPEVGYEDWAERYEHAVQSYLKLQENVRNIERRIATRPKLQGELDDVKRKLEVFERMGHEAILKEHSKRENQKAALVEAASGVKDAKSRLESLIEDFLPPDVPMGAFDPFEETDQKAIELIQEAESITEGARSQLKAVLDKLTDEEATWKGKVRESEAYALAQTAKKNYDELTQALLKEGVANLHQYGQLVQRRTQLEKELKELAELPATLKSQQAAGKAALDLVAQTRKEITDLRAEFIQDHIGTNPAVRIRISPYSLDPFATERQWREVLGKETKMSEPFLSEDGKEQMIGELYDGLPSDPNDARAELEKRIQDLKREVSEIVTGGNPKNRQAWLLTYFRSLPPETLDRLMCWWPKDNLEIDYAVGQAKDDFRPIQQGSPGQKTAGVLAFLLAFGNEPMILDQPEDDLDNQLIYDLIVSQLRENKKRRQVIIVTHNPNIVVNGDAEYVIPMDYRKGQSVLVDPPGPGSLQSRAIRDEVCRVMEGGRAAFTKRYRRLALEDVHV